MFAHSRFSLATLFSGASSPDVPFCPRSFFTGSLLSTTTAESPGGDIPVNGYRIGRNGNRRMTLSAFSLVVEGAVVVWVVPRCLSASEGKRNHLREAASDEPSNNSLSSF